MPGMNSSISQPSRMQSVNSPAPFGLDWGESVTADGGKANGSSVLPNCSNGVRGWAPGVGGIRSTGAEYEAFPTLGEVADIGKQTKRVHRRRRPGAKTTTTGSLHKMNVDDEDDGVLGTLTPENDGIHDGVPSPVGELHEDEQLNAVCPCEVSVLYIIVFRFTCN